MTFAVLDVIIILLIIYFTIKGYQKGFIRTLADSIKFFVAFYISKELSSVLSEIIAKNWLMPIIENAISPTFYENKLIAIFSVQDTISSVSLQISQGIAYTLVFFVMFFSISFILGLIVSLLDKIINFLFLSFINRLAGMILGAVFTLALSSLILGSVFAINKSIIAYEGFSDENYQKTIIIKHILNLEDYYGNANLQTMQ